MPVPGEAAEDAVVVVGRRRLGAQALRVLPRVVLLPHGVGPLERVRQPADLALGVRDLQLRELRHLPAEEVVAERRHRVVERDHAADAGRRVRATRTGRSTTSRRACTPSCPCRCTPRTSGPSSRCGCSAGRAGSGSSEKHTARTPRAALRSISFAASSTSHSGMMQSGMLMPIDGIAPLLDHPVVVGLHARQRELLVVGLVERLAAEARERRERQRAVDPVELEVLLALLGVPAAGPHVVVGGRRHRHGGLVELRQVVVGRRRLRDRDELLLDVDDLVLVDPGVAPLAFGVLGHLVLRALLQTERAPALALDARPLLPVLLGQPRLPDVRRLDDVVVDADDLRQLCHRDSRCVLYMTCVSGLR